MIAGDMSRRLTLEHISICTHTHTHAPIQTVTDAAGGGTRMMLPGEVCDLLQEVRVRRAPAHDLHLPSNEMDHSQVETTIHRRILTHIPTTTGKGTEIDKLETQKKREREKARRPARGHCGPK